MSTYYTVPYIARTVHRGVGDVEAAVTTLQLTASLKLDANKYYTPDDAVSIENEIHRQELEEIERERQQ